MVSTKVGGIPEVLPESMITLSEPNVSDLLINLEKAINNHRSGIRMNSIEMHEKIKKMYSWRDVAKRTEIVYNKVMQKPSPTTLTEKLLKYKFFKSLLKISN